VHQTTTMTSVEHEAEMRERQKHYLEFLDDDVSITTTGDMIILILIQCDPVTE
jgi:hypothetical protein